MKRIASFFFILTLLFIYPTIAAANSDTNSVVLKIGDNKVQVNGIVHRLETAPAIINAKTMVPLRFLAENFGASVAWKQELKEITVQYDDQLIILYPEIKQVTVNGTEKILDSAPVVIDGIALVPLRFLVESMNYAVDFVPESKSIHISKLPPPNQRPVANFTVSKSTVAQGETVTYEDKSYDPEGDEIVDRKWSGRERVFFKPGEYKVSLTVKDSFGNTSETYSTIIKVTDEVMMDQLTYNLNNPVHGEIVDMTSIPVLDLKQIEPAATMKRENIIISNSPETILEDGILYSDVVSGDNRLYYHHANGTRETKRVYLLAINQGSAPADLWIKNWGTAGPADPMSVGKVAAYKYLGINNMAQFITLQPGEKIIINKGINNAIRKGEAIHGMFDVSTNSKVLFSMVAVSSQDPVDDYEQLLVLPRDGKHIRGTFPRSQRSLLVQLPDTQKPLRLVVADGREDSFLYGEDSNTLRNEDTNLRSYNKGNYGLIYKVGIYSKQRVGVLFSARGGVFAGAASWDNEAFYLPNRGILQPKEGALLGVVNPGEKRTFTFIPPAGSFLPVNLIFVPF